MTSSTRALAILLLIGCDSAAPVDGGSPPGDAGDSVLDAGPGSSDAGVDAGAMASDAGHDAGMVSDIRFLLQGRAIDVTPDGSIAILEDPATGEVYRYDVGAGTSEIVTDVGDPARDFSTAVSADGHISAHHEIPVQAGVWDGTAWTDLPSPFGAGCDQDIASAWGLSADGTVVVGMAWDGCSPAAVRWTRGAGGVFTSTTLERLGSRSLGGLPANRATVVSDDGSVIAGFAENGAVDRWQAVWGADGAGELLPGSPEDAPGEILSISPDGRVLAGTQNFEAFLWSEADGLVVIGRLPTSFGADTAYPNAVAADGALVFGGCGGFGFTEAFVWTEADGMRTLAEVLETAGIIVPSGTYLQNVKAASNDGSVLLGTTSTDLGTPGTFVLRLPISAYGL